MTFSVGVLQINDIFHKVRKTDDTFDNNVLT